MATIDTSYFFGPLAIAQKSETTVSNSLSLFIDEQEDRLLTDLLGYDLYKEYKAGIASMTPDAKWIAIRDGKEFTTRYGYSTKWVGLKWTAGAAKKSIIANYVYWHWMKNEASITTGTGEKVADNQNATSVSPQLKMVNAWNEMVQWTRLLVEFLLTNDTDYPEFQKQFAWVPPSLLNKQNIFNI